MNAPSAVTHRRPEANTTTMPITLGIPMTSATTTSGRMVAWLPIPETINLATTAEI